MQAPSDVKDLIIIVAQRIGRVIYTMETVITISNVRVIWSAVKITVRGVRVMNVAWSDTSMVRPSSFMLF